MDGKKRRYEFETKVKVPDMDEIRKASGQFADPVVQDNSGNKSIPGAREAAKKQTNVLNNELSSIKNQLEELANEVVLEEQRHKEQTEKEAAETARVAAESQAEKDAAETKTETEKTPDAEDEVKDSEVAAEGETLPKEASEESGS